MTASWYAAGVGEADGAGVGLDEARRARRPPAAASAARRARVEHRRVEVDARDAWPAAASGTARRPLPLASSRIGPPARAASAR